MLLCCSQWLHLNYWLVWWHSQSVVMVYRSLYASYMVICSDLDPEVCAARPIGWHMSPGLHITRETVNECGNMGRTDIESLVRGGQRSALSWYGISVRFVTLWYTNSKASATVVSEATLTSGASMQISNNSILTYLLRSQLGLGWGFLVAEAIRYSASPGIAIRKQTSTSAASILFGHMVAHTHTHTTRDVPQWADRRVTTRWRVDSSDAWIDMRHESAPRRWFQ